ncbi:MAG: cell division ATP-binding protein FtsE [Candidatus Yonathbacteria bacterium]|nr:cell division ATP-binding protein FtsE [Candidatus Yonathbacteria bacterium]
MINFDNVSKEYRDNGNSITTALYDITLGVDQGEFVSIVGHSGAGKTTLLKLLLVEEAPSAGSVFFEDMNIHTLSHKEIPQLRRRIGTVFQDFKLLPNKTAYENIAFAMEAAGRSDEEIAADVPQALELVDLGDKIWNFPHQLSGGERQRVAIARAIINQPDLLIADEPTGNLDPLNTQDIVNVLRKINELGTTVILTTHNKGVIDTLGKRVITMEGGRIVRDDKHGRYVL